MTNIIDELSKLLVGKKVEKVEKAGVAESIALFTMEDGTKFRLHATDLGAWVEHLGTSDLLVSLDLVIREYCNHSYHNKVRESAPTVTVENGILTIIDNEGKKTKGKISSFSKEDQELANHPEGPTIIAYIAPCGDFWRPLLRSKDKLNFVPKELWRD